MFSSTAYDKFYFLLINRNTGFMIKTHAQKNHCGLAGSLQNTCRKDFFSSFLQNTCNVSWRTTLKNLWWNHWSTFLFFLWKLLASDNPMNNLLLEIMHSIFGRGHISSFTYPFNHNYFLIILRMTIVPLKYYSFYCLPDPN